MNHKTITLALITAMALGASGCGPEPSVHIRSSDAMTCGQSIFMVTSTCLPGTGELALNQCKPQELRVKTGTGERKAALPEMPTETIAAIKKAGRDPAALFVTEFGCTQSQGANVAVLYYSTGGAPGPASEVWVEYNEDGTMRGRSEPKIDSEARAVLDRNMRHVRSIMPRDPVKK